MKREPIYNTKCWKRYLPSYLVGIFSLKRITVRICSRPIQSDTLNATLAVLIINLKSYLHEKLL